MNNLYIDVVNLVEQLHRTFHDVVETELALLRASDISTVQAMILYNIGKQELTVTDIAARNCYQGTNVSYNLSKLVKNNYLEKRQSQADNRTFYVRLSTKGAILYGNLHKAFLNHTHTVNRSSKVLKDFGRLYEYLLELSQFWTILSHDKKTITPQTRKLNHYEIAI